MNDAEIGVELGNTGLQWVKESLALGLAISEAFLAGDTLSSMQSVALVPSDTPRTSLDNPEEDRLAFGRKVGVEALAAFLRVTSAGEERVLVVEDELFQPDDPWVKEGGLHFSAFTRGLEFYHWLTVEETLSTEQFNWFLNESTSGYPTNAFVLKTVPSEFESSVRTEVSPAQIASAVSAVVVGAYDDIAYIAAITPARSL